MQSGAVGATASGVVTMAPPGFKHPAAERRASTSSMDAAAAVPDRTERPCSPRHLHGQGKEEDDAPPALPAKFKPENMQPVSRRLFDAFEEIAVEAEDGKETADAPAPATPTNAGGARKVERQLPLPSSPGYGATTESGGGSRAPPAAPKKGESSGRTNAPLLKPETTESSASAKGGDDDNGEDITKKYSPACVAEFGVPQQQQPGQAKGNEKQKLVFASNSKSMRSDDDGLVGTTSSKAQDGTTAVTSGDSGNVVQTTKEDQEHPIKAAAPPAAPQKKGSSLSSLPEQGQSSEIVKDEEEEEEEETGTRPVQMMPRPTSTLTVVSAASSSSSSSEAISIESATIAPTAVRKAAPINASPTKPSASGSSFGSPDPVSRGGVGSDGCAKDPPNSPGEILVNAAKSSEAPVPIINHPSMSRLKDFGLHDKLRLQLSQPLVNRVSFYGIIHDINKEAASMAAEDHSAFHKLQSTSDKGGGGGMGMGGGGAFGKPPARPRVQPPQTMAPAAASGMQECGGNNAAAATNGDAALIDEEEWLLSVIASRSAEETRELQEKQASRAASSTAASFAYAIGDSPDDTPPCDVQQQQQDAAAVAAAAAGGDGGLAAQQQSTGTKEDKPNPIGEINGSSRTRLWKPSRSWWEARSGKNPWIDPVNHVKRWRYLWPLIYYHKFLAKCIKKLKRHGVTDFLGQDTSPVISFLRHEIIAVSDHLANCSKFVSEEWLDALVHFTGWNDTSPEAHECLSVLVARQKLRSFAEPMDPKASPLVRKVMNNSNQDRYQGPARTEVQDNGGRNGGGRGSKKGNNNNNNNRGNPAAGWHNNRMPPNGAMMGYPPHPAAGPYGYYYPPPHPHAHPRQYQGPPMPPPHAYYPGMPPPPQHSMPPRGPPRRGGGKGGGRGYGGAGGAYPPQQRPYRNGRNNRGYYDPRAYPPPSYPYPYPPTDQYGYPTHPGMMQPPQQQPQQSEERNTSPSEQQVPQQRDHQPHPYYAGHSTSHALSQHQFAHGGPTYAGGQPVNPMHQVQYGAPPQSPIPPVIQGQQEEQGAARMPDEVAPVESVQTTNRPESVPSLLAQDSIDENSLMEEFQEDCSHSSIPSSVAPPPPGYGGVGGGVPHHNIMASPAPEYFLGSDMPPSPVPSQSSPFWGHLDQVALMCTDASFSMMDDSSFTSGYSAESPGGVAYPRASTPNGSRQGTPRQTPNRSTRRHSRGKKKRGSGNAGSLPQYAKPLLFNPVFPHAQYRPMSYGGMERQPPSPATQFLMSPQVNPEAVAFYGGADSSKTNPVTAHGGRAAANSPVVTNTTQSNVENTAETS